MTNHFKNLSDLSAQTLVQVLDLADKLKAERGQTEERPLAGKQVALVFEKASTRTRLSLEVAVNELGGSAIVLTSSGSQMGRGEPVRDSARVLGRMVHGITMRTSDESRLMEMMKFSGLPVLNALTDQSHPMQIMADLQAVRAHFKELDARSLQDLIFTWVGDGNNMACSWIEAAGLLGLQLRLACPQGYEPPESWLKEARDRGAVIQVSHNIQEVVSGADVVSTDVFTSMGQEEETQARLKAFDGFQVNSSLMKLAHPHAVVLHCLPAHRGEEISEDVLEGPQSLVWDEAESRLHTSKALLIWAFGLL